MFKKKEPSKLDEAIDDIYREMAGYTSDTDEYDKMTAQLERLYNLREGNRIRVTPDTLVIAGANVLAVLLIVGNERMHVITSRAMNLVRMIK